MNTERKPIFRGVCTALATPFKDGRVDFDALARMLEYQMQGGVAAVALCGTTGEAPTLEEEECIDILRFARKCVGERMLLIAGTGTNCTKSALRRTENAAKSGADALLVVTPYYNKGTADGVFAHYMEIASASKLPLILYNVPTRTGVDLSLELMHRLSVHPQIVALKEACGNFDKMARFMHELGSRYTLYSGNDSQILPTLALGGSGVVSVVSNVLPKRTTLLCRAYFEGDTLLAATLQSELLPFIELLFKETNPAPVKAALAMLGLCENELRLPLAPISLSLERAIEAELARLLPLEKETVL